MKGVGYLISMVSVLLLGLVAWPRPDEPEWKATILIAGMAASIVGIGLRYLAHRNEQREIERTEATR